MKTATPPPFDHVNVLCIGDIMLDRFVTGSVTRISPESPVPIVLIEGSESIPGGSANVGRNVASLGGRCTLVGLIGEDAGGREVLSLLSEDPAITPRLIAAPRPTTEKTRYVAGGQHVLRVDSEKTVELDATSERALIELIDSLIDGHHVMVLSDYAKGALTKRVIRAAIDGASLRGIPIIVDPKSSDLSRYSGATVVTPNRKEAREATGIDPIDDQQAELSGRMAISTAGLRSVLLTRAERGMTLVSVDEVTINIPATAREVFDVVGAGDTVVATLSLCLGAGCSLENSARFANAAAGIVVGKHGTATVTRPELINTLEYSEPERSKSARSIFTDRQGGKRLIESWRRAGLKIGFTNGCFDIIHAGHIRLLDFAKSNCDRLMVAIDSDRSVSKLKGANRPIIHQSDRASLIGAIGAVDGVMIFESEHLPELIRYLQPDLLFKGGDYQIDQIVGAAEVIETGGVVLTCPLAQGRSTSRILDRIGLDV